MEIFYKIILFETSFTFLVGKGRGLFAFGDSVATVVDDVSTFCCFAGVRGGRSGGDGDGGADVGVCVGVCVGVEEEEGVS